MNCDVSKLVYVSKLLKCFQIINLVSKLKNICMSCFQVIAKNLDQAQNWQYQENHASHISGEFPDILYS